jgi:hypothetical protein
MEIAETVKGVDSMIDIQLEAYRPPIEDGRGIFPEDFRVETGIASQYRGGWREAAAWYC